MKYGILRSLRFKELEALVISEEDENFSYDPPVRLGIWMNESHIASGQKFALEEFSMRKEIEGARCAPVALLFQRPFLIGADRFHDHLAKETLPQFQGQGLMKTLYNIREKLFGIFQREHENLYSNIRFLQSVGYEVKGTRNSETHGIEPLTESEKTTLAISIRDKTVGATPFVCVLEKA